MKVSKKRDEKVSYHGLFDKGQESIFGVITTPEAVYWGLHDKCIPTHYGILIRKNEQYRFEGTFKDGKYHDGELQTADWTYTGSFQDCQKEGRGELVDKEGHIYEGEFRKGRMHGEGKMFCPTDKIEYAGSWKQGVRDGMF